MSITPDNLPVVGAKIETLSGEVTEVKRRNNGTSKNDKSWSVQRLRVAGNNKTVTVICWNRDELNQFLHQHVTLIGSLSVIEDENPKSGKTFTAVKFDEEGIIETGGSNTQATTQGSGEIQSSKATYWVTDGTAQPVQLSHEDARKAYVENKDILILRVGDKDEEWKTGSDYGFNVQFAPTSVPEKSTPPAPPAIPGQQQPQQSPRQEKPLHPPKSATKVEVSYRENRIPREYESSAMQITLEVNPDEVGEAYKYAKYVVRKGLAASVSSWSRGYSENKQ